MKKHKRRISLSVKMYILIAVIICSVSGVLTFTGYSAFCKKVDEIYFAKAERAAEMMATFPMKYLDNMREKILSDEFQNVRKEAIDANDEKIIEDWMRRQESSLFEIYVVEEENDYLPEEMFPDLENNESLYDDYEFLRVWCEFCIEFFDVNDIYVQYMENGITYNLVDPNENLFYIGTTEEFIKEFEGYEDNSYVPPTVYHSMYGWLCTTCEPVLNEEGDQVLGIACVDIDMNEVMKNRRWYLLNCLLLIVFELAAAIVISMLVVRHAVTRPLKLLATAATGFASDAKSLSKEEIIQLPIRSNDEIGDLYHEIQLMQERIVDVTVNITRITAERERVDTELRMATEIQASVLPNAFPAFPDRDEFDLYASMDPAKEVGGDFYDFFMTDDDHLCLMIADVSDKGVPAALFMMSAKNLLNYRAREGGTPSEIMSAVNAQLCRNNTSKMFVTVWLGILELSTGKLTCTNAGHEYPFVRARDGIFRKVEDKHCMMAGALAKAKYSDYELILEPGDAVFVYTDGIPEASNAEKEFYGMKRLEQALNEQPDASPETILMNVRKDVDIFSNGAKQFDDITMLCVEYKTAKH